MRFLKGFLADPLTVGSIIPSSRQLSKKMLNSKKFEEAKMVVEVGTGTGPVTAVILENLPLQAHYLGLDLNSDFIIGLKKKYPHAHFLAESVENLPEILKREKLKKVDYLISGLPWTLFSDELQNTLLKAISASMEDDGEIATFVYLHVLYTPLGRRFMKNLKKYFSDVAPKKIAFWNLPSAAVIRARKNAKGVPIPNEE
jgi:phosphatidylethanolamine/phosphatidyl-N-methylethanolamine N-methyltransferase